MLKKKDMDKIYRVRKFNNNTLEEIKNNYLWCSLRSGFKDKYDANIGAFISNTPALLKGLELKFDKEYISKLIENMNKVGICCFTRELPSQDTISHFPNGKSNCVCIEYDKKSIEDHLLNHSQYTISKVFHDVIYACRPTQIDQHGDYQVLIDQDDNGKQYESVLSICNDIKDFDNLIRLLLTRININFNKQKESRIIVGGPNFKFLETDAFGYKIDIPPTSITAIYLYSEPKDDSEKKFISELYTNSEIKPLLRKLY